MMTLLEEIDLANYYLKILKNNKSNDPLVARSILQQLIFIAYDQGYNAGYEDGNNDYRVET